MNEITVKLNTSDSGALRATAVYFTALADAAAVAKRNDAEQADSGSGAAKTSLKDFEETFVERVARAMEVSVSSPTETLAAADIEPEAHTITYPADGAEPKASIDAKATLPTATIPAPTEDPASREGVDADGLPWDVRIHSDAKVSKKQDGRWKTKRGVHPSVIQSVTAELRTPAAPALDGALPSPPPPPPPVPSPHTYVSLLDGMNAGAYTHQQLDEACIKHGLSGFAFLVAAPDLVPTVAKELGLE